MPSILFISDRNILNATGERTLIMDRAATLYREFGISTRVLLIRPGRVAAPEGKSLPLPDGVSIESSIYKTPWELRKQMKIAMAIANDMRPTQVVFSGLIVPNWVSRFSAAGHSTCVDVHGDVDEWVEYPPRLMGKAAIGRMAAPVAKWMATRSVRNADSTFVVSKRTEGWVKSIGGGKVFRIPCCTSDIPSLDQWKASRSTYREKLGIPSDATVWMYSGGTSGWQLLPETIALATQIARHDEYAVFVFATSAGESLFAEMGLGDVPEQFRLVKLPANEVVPALCAADAGFMLRNNSHTNNAAFPNKFSEYLAAGLFVVTGEGLSDPAEIVRDNDIGTVLTDEELFNPNASQAEGLIRDQRTRSLSIGALTRQALNDIHMSKTLRDYVSYLQGMC